MYSVDNTLPTLRGAWLLYVAPKIEEGSCFLYLFSVLTSSRSVIDGTTRTQPTSHTSNRVAYSRSDASSAEEQGWLEGLVDWGTRLALRRNH